MDVPLRQGLPLYVFALCRYRLSQPVQLEHGETATFTLNSLEHSFVPNVVKRELLATVPKTRAVFEDFTNGIQDWSTRDQRTIKTYKFQSPDLDRSNDKKLSLTMDPQGRQLTLRLKASSKFLSRADNIGDFTFAGRISGKGIQKLVVNREDFRGDGGKILEWSRIATFEVTLIDESTKSKLDLTSPEGHAILQSIRLVD